MRALQTGSCLVISSVSPELRLKIKHGKLLGMMPDREHQVELPMVFHIRKRPSTARSAGINKMMSLVDDHHTLSVFR